MQELSFLSQKEQEMFAKSRCSDEHISKFRTVIRKVDKMKCEEFSKFKCEVNPGANTSKINSRCLSEAILLYTTAKS